MKAARWGVIAHAVAEFAADFDQARYRGPKFTWEGFPDLAVRLLSLEATAFGRRPKVVAMIRRAAEIEAEQRISARKET